MANPNIIKQTATTLQHHCFVPLVDDLDPSCSLAENGQLAQGPETVKPLSAFFRARNTSCENTTIDTPLWQIQ